MLIVAATTHKAHKICLQSLIFSVIVAQFLVASSSGLQPDYNAVTASLLTELVLAQRALNNGNNASTVSQSALTYGSIFTPSSREVWLNGLWFVSLAFALVTALGACVARQWLNNYGADISGRSPKVQAITRHFRYRGFVQWGYHLLSRAYQC